jgi:hypothetical protein
MKRLSAVAIGVALCAIATGAEAHSDRMRVAAYDSYRPFSDGEWEDARPHHRRRLVRAAKRRRRAAYWRAPRHPARAMRLGALGWPRAGRRRSSFAFPHAAISRTCLTSAARGLLARIEARFGPVEVVSTCRPGAVIAGTNHPSRHASGNAIDFNAPKGRKAEVVRWLIANHHTGGVMTYSDMNHIHVDIGPHFVVLAAPSHRGWRRASRF